MPRVLIVRGQYITPWELGPWNELPERFEVSYLLIGSNRYSLPGGRLRPVRVRALRDLFPKGMLGEIGARVIGGRYLDADRVFAAADIVHAEELSFWFSGHAGRLQRTHRFRLVQTVWETLPLLETFRTYHARRHRREVLAGTDLFMPTTERAANALRLEGVPSERIKVSPPGIDLGRFGAIASGSPPREHVILSPGRLVWEKGHHDVLRAVAALHSGMVSTPDGGLPALRVWIIGSGPEEERLRSYARELGLGEMVEVRSHPYEDMPQVFACASAIVLASLPLAYGAYHPLAIPRAFWEEQFGLVLAEGMAAGLGIVATTSGAIPEVLAGTSAQLVAPGDWMEIARKLAAGPLSRPPGQRVQYPAQLVERFSNAAAAARLAEAYTALLS